MSWKTSLLFLCVILNISNIICTSIICEHGFCADFRIEVGCTAPAQHCGFNNATHHGLTLPSPTICNCCEYCLPNFLEGQHCSLGGVGNGLTVGRCGPGLFCTTEEDGNFCRRINATISDCHRDQDKYDERHRDGTSGTLEQRPECDGKGRYGPADCVPTQTCFCRADDGHRIFGEVLYQGHLTIRNMHCLCSRMHEKIQSLIRSGLREPIVGPRCTSDGNFYPVQCIRNICYCVDRITGLAQEGDNIDLEVEPISKLPCYDPELNLFGDLMTYNFSSPCLEDMKERIELVRESIDAGFNTDFFSTIPECLPDGSYGRIAININKTKTCVDERGDPIGEYEVELDAIGYDEMDCKCAVTSILMANSLEKPVCCKNGNFRKIQCRRGMCRCVDSDGRQRGQESSDVRELTECFTEDWRIC